MTHLQKLSYVQGVLIGMQVTTHRNDPMIREALDYVNQLFSVVGQADKELQKQAGIQANGGNPLVSKHD